MDMIKDVPGCRSRFCGSQAGGGHADLPGQHEMAAGQDEIQGDGRAGRGEAEGNYAPGSTSGLPAASYSKMKRSGAVRR